MRQHETTTLPDGRRLAFDLHGRDDGEPLFFFHGAPGCRLEWPLFISDELPRRLGWRVIAPDRPRVGRSEPRPGREMTDWPTDVDALANALGIARFAVLGYSIGGPYALACAAAVGDRVTGAAVVSCAGPLTWPGVADAIPANSRVFLERSVNGPRSARMILRMLRLAVSIAPRLVRSQMRSSFPPPDRALLDDNETFEQFRRELLEALRQGPTGPQVDTALAMRDWGFEPETVGLPVAIWQGGLDSEAPPIVGQTLAERMPRGRLRFLPEEGHLSLFYRHREAILSALLEAARLG